MRGQDVLDRIARRSGTLHGVAGEKILLGIEKGLDLSLSLLVLFRVKESALQVTTPRQTANRFVEWPTGVCCARHCGAGRKASCAPRRLRRGNPGWCGLAQPGPISFQQG